MSSKEKEFHVVQKALGGDQKAYTAIYKKYYDSLYYQLGKIVRDKEVCSDVTIEAFERAFEALHRYTPEFSFSTWLFRIGINCAIDYVRKSNRVQLIRIEQNDPERDDIPMFQLKDPSKTPEEQSIFAQRIDFIRAVIAELPYCQRRMLELRYIDDFSYDEIADELGVALGTVKGTIHRAKEILQEKIFKDKDPRYTGLCQV